ncbi:glycosyltransferase family 2 [Lecanosticta acicola]|uniref:chitin synthase n=1 Tax=Lecanosticta acicola TaxID=111012 RepID=A0AAI8Z2B8_9PEZI|nr:glycosyltransferase family 2 [Lecanosticta acicola]
MLWIRHADNGVPSIIAPWPVADIVYVAIIAPIMLAAFLEWILFLVAFQYCFVQVFRKADGEQKWSVRILCVLNIVWFTLLRCIFLPIMVVTLPLPSQVAQYFPQQVVDVLQWFAFYTFAGLLIVPWLLCVYQLVTRNVGRGTLVKKALDEYSAPKVVIIMPCYNEEPDILIRTVESIVHCDYPAACLHIFLSFDGGEENELFLSTIGKLGVPVTLEAYPKSIDIAYEDCRITVSRFPHGGKRKCQKHTFRLIDKVYAEYLRRNDDLFLLFIDSDCILDKNCIKNFMYDMELKPGSKHDVLAMTGVITSTTMKNSLITVLQDMEYIHGQLFERTVESACGAVTCLPGALTMLRFSAFGNMAKYYFAAKAETCEDMFDYGKCHLGEDRWLTHLFMIGAQKRYQIGMCTSAFCKTEAVQTWKSLLKQRRRWFLGYITNEVCMLTDARLWWRYPLLLIMRLMQNSIRTTALLFFIMVISIVSTSQKIKNLPVGFIAVSLGLNWVLMLYFGGILGRWKITLYPIMFVVNPFMNWLYMVHGIFTCGQRTWGGPRADASKADATTSPEQAVAEAEAKGDVLNVLPETFMPAVDQLGRKKSVRTPLQPSSRLEGRFAAAEEVAPGYYQQGNDSGALRANMAPRGYGDVEMAIYNAGSRRDSAESFLTSDHSIPTPRRVESFVGMDAYHGTSRGQVVNDGARYEPAVHQQQAHVAPGFDLGFRPSSSRRESAESERDDRSVSSVDMHFSVPSRDPTVLGRGSRRETAQPRPPSHQSPLSDLRLGSTMVSKAVRYEQVAVRWQGSPSQDWQPMTLHPPPGAGRRWK